MARLFICGDIVNRSHADGILCADDLAAVIAGADYAAGNFEGAIRGHGTPQAKVGAHIQQLEDSLAGLKRQGFDLLLLANNHIMDFGAAGLEATLAGAASAGLETLGAGLTPDRAYRPLIKDIGGVRIALINACEAQFGALDRPDREVGAGYAWINHARIDQAILRSKRECDFAIVLAHAGLENFPIPQREWRERYRHFCDLGADAVVAAHPHAPQGYERYGNSLIFYSLGNFYFDRPSPSDRDDSSYAVLLELERGRPIAFEPVYHYTRDGLVRLAPNDRKIDLDALCGMLGDGYEAAHDAMVAQAYETYRQRLRYALAEDPPARRLKKTLRRLAGLPPGDTERDRQKRLMQLHLFRNEAYYYVARRALELQAGKASGGSDAASPG